MIRFFFICFIILLSIHGKTQDELWLHSPIKHKVKLAGTFGELRNNHFHTGIDIKSSNGKVGDQLFAVADGVVRRINISSGGYGHVLYIDHPNGYTTVYAHMDSFREDIENFVVETQYARETYEFDTTFTTDVFLVKQGEEIGKMGTTGRSYGPHLHFEVRETESEIPINPLHFYNEVEDGLSPKVDYLLINILDDKKHKRASQKISLIQNGNSYKPAESVLKIPGWRIGLGVYVRDLMTGVSNKNGIYKAELKVDGQSVYSYSMDSISFDDFRYLNAHIDYEHYMKTKHRVHQLYKKPGNKLKMYRDSMGSVIKLYAEKERKVLIELQDFHKNISTIEFAVKRDTSMQDYQYQPYEYKLDYNSPHIISKNDIKLKFPEGCFYEDAFISVSQTKEIEEHYNSDVFHVGHENIPVHGLYDLYLKPYESDSSIMEKSSIVLCDEKKYHTYGGYVLDNLIGAKVGAMGNYVVMIDTIPPEIKEIAVPVEVMKGSRIIFEAIDNLNAKGRAHDLRHKAYLDDKWILFSYDMKNDRFIHEVDDKWTVGKHELRFEVEDDQGNVAIWKRSILKK